MIICRPKPNRSVPRRFTKADAARVCCAVLREGETVFTELVEEIRARCPDKTRKMFPDEAASAVAVDWSDVLSDDNREWDRVLQMLSIINALILAISVLLAITRLIPGPTLVASLPVSVGLGRLRSVVRNFHGSILTRKAANDNMIRQIQDLTEKGVQITFKRAA